MREVFREPPRSAVVTGVGRGQTGGVRRGRPRILCPDQRYCGHPCRQAAHRRRSTPPAQPPQFPQVRPSGREHTVYECGERGQRCAGQQSANDPAEASAPAALAPAAEIPSPSPTSSRRLWPNLSTPDHVVTASHATTMDSTVDCYPIADHTADDSSHRPREVRPSPVNDPWVLAVSGTDPRRCRDASSVALWFWEESSGSGTGGGEGVLGVVQAAGRHRKAAAADAAGQLVAHLL